MIKEVAKVNVKQLGKTERYLRISNLCLKDIIVKLLRVWMDFFKQTHIKSRLYYATFLQKTSYLSIIFHHDVTVVAITNAQYKGGNTVASTRTCKQVNSCIIPIENKQNTFSYR